LSSPDSIAYLQHLLDDTIPSAFLARKGLFLDPWQTEVADGRDPLTLVCCSRQSGKTEGTAGLVGHCLETTPDALVLVLAPSERQSRELLRKAKAYIDYNVTGKPLTLAATSIELPNGARAFALPGSEETVRGFSAPTMIVVDEAAMAADALYYAVRPMMATVSETSRLILMSTPKGKRGFFYDEWFAPSMSGVKKISVTVDQIPRIPQSFIDRERERLPEWLFRQEYMCEFVDNNMQIFGSDLIDSAFVRGHSFAGINLGRFDDAGIMVDEEQGAFSI
jgi:hypothetical protein